MLPAVVGGVPMLARRTRHIGHVVRMRVSLGAMHARMGMRRALDDRLSLSERQADDGERRQEPGETINPARHAASL